MNPAEWLQRTALRRPDAPALYRGTVLEARYAAFAGRAARIGAGLAALGVQRGERVALFMANRTEYLEALYGIWWCGAAAVPINGKLHPREAGWILRDAGARIVFVDDASSAALAPELPDGVTLRSVQGDAFHGWRTEGTPAAPADMLPSDMAWMFYTSGTTGTPKGVMITAANFASMALSYFVDVDEVRDDDLALYAAPMSHGAGLYNFMHVLRGAAHVVPESGGFDPGEVLDLAAHHGAGRDRISMFAAPPMVRRLVEAARARGETGAGLRTVVYAGGPLYEADILEAVRVMGPRFVQIYGQGECPMGITALARADVSDRSRPRWRDRLNSVGTAQAQVRVAVVDADGRARTAGESGEVVVKGATVMAGYWNNARATAETIRDGWLRTGDVGRLDADGYLTLQDRSKDVIISGGSNIYPREVEEVLLTHPDVAEVSVVGMADPEWGEVVVAFVVSDVGEVVPDEAALDALCFAQIARFKRPKMYRFVDGLPKNNYGKVLKTELRRVLDQV